MTEVCFGEKGSFSYELDKVVYVVIKQHLTARVARIDNDVARLYLADADSIQQQQIP